MSYVKRAVSLNHWLQPLAIRLRIQLGRTLWCLPMALVGVSCGLRQPTAPIVAAPQPVSSQTGSCTFPRNTDAEFGLVRLRVYVNADGSPGQVEILEASEPAFGEQARKCALRKRYKPSTNDAGMPIGAYSPIINLRFTR